MPNFDPSRHQTFEGLLGRSSSPKASQDLKGLRVHRVHAGAVDLDSGIQGDTGALEVCVVWLCLDQVIQVLDEREAPGVLGRDFVLGGQFQALTEHISEVSSAQGLGPGGSPARLGLHPGCGSSQLRGTTCGYDARYTPCTAAEHRPAFAATPAAVAVDSF